MVRGGVRGGSTPNTKRVNNNGVKEARLLEIGPDVVEVGLGTSKTARSPSGWVTWVLSRSRSGVP
jgi:hypothetical protein